ncbi:tripartite tricarboxylate transporter TctB family protein [Leifsonia sp. NPDC058194]|uniref:tripartite tricarboxylate transporter TctB family protein n=1 Tax=Leifsonia sp. NPDC058194 TaxID=3346374 RepID=UPI0036D8C05E
MSDTTPDPASADTGEQRATPVEPATGAASSAAAEAHDTDPEVVDPPSSPVSARGHVNRPAAEAPADAPVAPPVAAASAAPAAPSATPVTEPEPVVSTEDDIAAAVARTAAQPGEAGATAAGTATVDTASPAEAATPVVLAAAAAAETQTQAAPAATAAYGTAPVAGATWAPEPTGAPVPLQPQPVAPIFLQRPEPPKRKSNRGVGILIVLVGTVAFALLWSVAVVVVDSLVTPRNDLLTVLLQSFTQVYAGWVPILAFFVGMVVLVQIVNRARWWAYILGGLVVGVFVYFAFIGAYLIDAQYWQRTPAEFAILLRSAWLNPFAVLAGVIAREISVWTGAWLAARGRKLKARNAEAQADYEQQLADAQNQAVAAYATQQGY